MDVPLIDDEAEVEREGGRAGEDAQQHETKSYALCRWRWFVLFFYSVANCNQCLAWFTFSSTSMADMAAYFGGRIDKPTLDLLLNWGPIVGVILFPVQTRLIGSHDGLRRAIWSGILLVFIGNVIRCIPIVMCEAGWDKSFKTSLGAFALYHIGQILIAAAGPMLMGAPTRFAVVWFPESERTTCTAIAATANGLGATVGFLNPIWLCRTANRIPNVFWFSMILAVIPVVCAAVYFPPGPPEAPSAAAIDNYKEAPELHYGENAKEGADEDAGWWRALVLASRNRSFMQLATSMAFLTGVAIAWQSLLQQILAPTGMDPQKVSWIGFGNGLSGNLAAILAGGIVDRWLQQRLKFGITAGVIGCMVSTGWFTLMLPCFAYTHAPLPRSEPLLIAALTLAGFFQGVATPLAYELSAELIYPIQEGMSAGILVLMLNLSAFLMILLHSLLDKGYMNVIMTATIAAVLVNIIAVREEYKRPKNAAEQVQPAGGLIRENVGLGSILSCVGLDPELETEPRDGCCRNCGCQVDNSTRERKVTPPLLQRGLDDEVSGNHRQSPQRR